MRFIIFVSDRLRTGQYPKLPDFQYSQAHDKWVFGGRELEAEEFNAAAAKVFHPDYYSKGFHFLPLAIEAKKTDPAITIRDDGTVLQGDTQIGFVTKENKRLRVFKEYSHLRDKITNLLPQPITT